MNYPPVFGTWQILRWFRKMSGQSNTYPDVMIQLLMKVFYGMMETPGSGRLAMIPT